MVFAGKRTPAIHNEIVSIYNDNGQKMAKCEQYGSTLATMEHNRIVLFTVKEIRWLLNHNAVYVILAR
jgi:hypothetical protein